MAKNLVRVSVKLQIWHTSKLLCAEEKNKHFQVIFLTGALIVVKIGFFVIQIFSKYLPNIFKFKTD